MFSVFAALVVQLRNTFADRRDLLLENAALRHQLAIYQPTATGQSLPRPTPLLGRAVPALAAGAQPSSSCNSCSDASARGWR